MRGNQTKFRFEQFTNAEERKVCKLYIYDDVTAYGDFNWETWEYEESETSANFFRNQLNEIPADGKIELHVNSYGGDVKEGIAIYNLLKKHEAEKICYVDGFAYSIASVICMACDKIIMGLGTSMMIHNMAMRVYGNAEMLRKCADDLDVLMESNRQIYMERAKNLSEEALIDMMNKETFLTPDQCLEYGFCDEVGTEYADPNRLNQQSAVKMQQLMQQLSSMQSFKQEMKQFVQGNIHKEITKESEKTNNVDKALKMMSAFLNAI